MLTWIALSATAAPTTATWNLDEGTTHRWAIETEVVVPGFMWLYADANTDVRARNVGVQMVMNCVAGVPTRRAGILECEIEDAALTGATFVSERGRLQRVLDEMDDKLTGASATLVMRPNGRVRTVKLRPRSISSYRNRRTRYMEQAMRLLLVRAVAPFDLTLPDRGLERTSWPQFESLVLTLPTQRGTAGSGRLVHSVTPHDADRVIVSTLGEAVLIDGGSVDAGGGLYLSTEVSGVTVFDHVKGRISEAIWTVYGEPTASAGVFAQSYASRTILRELAPDEVVELHPTREWSPPIRGMMGFMEEMAPPS